VVSTPKSSGTTTSIPLPGTLPTVGGLSSQKLLVALILLLASFSKSTLVLQLIVLPPGLPSAPPPRSGFELSCIKTPTEFPVIVLPVISAVALTLVMIPFELFVIVLLAIKGSAVSVTSIPVSRPKSPWPKKFPLILGVPVPLTKIAVEQHPSKSRKVLFVIVGDVLKVPMRGDVLPSWLSI